MNNSETWYVVKQDNGQCAILPLNPLEAEANAVSETAKEQWGPYTSESEAIARRIGLIRAGKCQPA